jgi:tRNA 2-thiouridine synthesizing protein A
MSEVVDARGLRCPIPALRARAALMRLADGAALEVLATDPEAPIDLAAVAADAGLPFAVTQEAQTWRCVLGPRRGSPPR